MDDNQESASTQLNQPQETPQQINNPDVGFPVGQTTPKAKPTKLILIILIVILLIGGGIFLWVRRGAEESESTESEVEGVETTASPEATSTPAPVDKTKVEIEIQNGTGISGEAAFLQGELRNLGYTDIKTSNADRQDHTATKATFSKSLSKEAVDEITKKLKELYKEVNTETSSLSGRDVLIVTGLRKGATPKPSPTQAPASPSPTASPTVTASPTSTPTPTPTPT